jgi:hypothetical protein
VTTEKRIIVMEVWPLIRQLISALRDFLAPRYRPERHYMRGPGPAYARRASSLDASVRRDDFDHVEPTGVRGRVVELDASDETTRL